jgi:REP element-mobilizing transposase RayT
MPILNMPVRQTIPFTNGIFFITFTCHDWIHLIEKVNGYNIIYKWFDVLKEKGHHLNCFVIMPNHVHGII